ncbi:hypothetical protein ACQB6R_01205 [Propionibacteriaceae bacterium G1746]
MADLERRYWQGSGIGGVLWLVLAALLPWLGSRLLMHSRESVTRPANLALVLQLPVLVVLVGCYRAARHDLFDSPAFALAIGVFGICYTFAVMNSWWRGVRSGDGDRSRERPWQGLRD